MSLKDIAAVIVASDYARARYCRVLGRKPDLAWLQLITDPDRPGKTNEVSFVEDIDNP